MLIKSHLNLLMMGGILGEVEAAAEVRDSLRRHGFVALTKLDFSGKEIFTLTQFFHLHHHLR